MTLKVLPRLLFHCTPTTPLPQRQAAAAACGAADLTAKLGRGTSMILRCNAGAEQRQQQNTKPVLIVVVCGGVGASVCCPFLLLPLDCNFCKSRFSSVKIETTTLKFTKNQYQKLYYCDLNCNSFIYSFGTVLVLFYKNSLPYVRSCK
jgi:hypothetical protein